MFWGSWVGRRDVGVVDPEDLRVPVRVSIGSNFGGPKHNEGAGIHIDGVAIASDVVGRVVHGELLCRIYSVVHNSDRVSFLVRKKAGIISIKTLTKKPAEEMNAELVDEILKTR